MEEKLKIFIMPTFDTTRRSLGYEEEEDGDTNTILYRQGYDGEYISIEDDEIFVIRPGYIGKIESRENYYLLPKETHSGDKEEYLIKHSLKEGRYRLSIEDHVIHVLGKNRFSL